MLKCEETDNQEVSAGLCDVHADYIGKNNSYECRCHNGYTGNGVFCTGTRIHHTRAANKKVREVHSNCALC